MKTIKRNYIDLIRSQIRIIIIITMQKGSAFIDLGGLKEYKL